MQSLSKKDPCPCGKLKSNGKPRKYKNCCFQKQGSSTKDFVRNSEPRKGFNESEDILIQVADGSFLRMWSYPNVFYSPQKELCDLLVVFENKVIIFSDKRSEIKELNEVNWKRWHNRAIEKSIKQATTAKGRILKGMPVYTDSKCLEEIPIEFPKPQDMKVYLVCVANGATKACRDFYGDSRGSLFVSSLKTPPPIPFIVDLITEKDEFVHVLDDLSLKNVLENLDTITDFTDYLCEKEEFMRKVGVLTGGEEDLLATYLKSFNEEDKKRDFSDLEKQGMDFLYLEEGIWESYIENPQYLAKKEADEVSYLWDFIIERFTEHSIKGTQYLPNPNGVSGTEQAIRMMAKERRFFRRILSKSLSDLVAKPEGNGVRRRFAKSPENEEAGYAFLAMRKEDGMNEDEYRKMRRELLYAMCLVYKYRFPELKIITGLATETSDCVSNNRYSEDVVSYQADELSEQEKEDAEYLSKEMGILDGKNTAWYNASDQEYPTS